MMASELKFAVLGPVRAWRDETELDVGTPQQRAVLAVLLLAEGQLVSLDTLVSALWGPDSPKAAAGTVRTYVSRLRQCLAPGTPAGGQDVIGSAGDGYLLPIRHASFDLRLFTQLTAQARTTRSAGDPARAAALLRDALGLWCGTPLAGLPGEYVQAQRTRLAELRLAAIEERLALDIGLGGHIAAVAELPVLIAAYPLRERLAELLMLALYRADRQAEALAVFDRTRRILNEELGIDPGHALRDIHQRILRADSTLIATGPETAHGATDAPYRESRLADLPGREQAITVQRLAGTQGLGRLPVSVTSLLGREQAIGEVTRLVGQAGARLVTLTGPGGVGKTRLAVAIGERLAGRFSAGTVFVPLDAVTDPDLVPAAIGRAAGADLARTSAPLEAVAEAFGDGAWLLIVDNLEQVIQAARYLGELLARCPRVRVIATSRTVLGLRAEREYPVPPLPVPANPKTATAEEAAASPAVALFADRARAVRPGFALTDGNATAVAEICQRLEGLPLAIELAAARTRLLDPATLFERLVASLDALGTGAVDLPERQRTLRATVEWSVSLLAAPERFLLETAAVFMGGWTLPALTWIADVPEDRALDLSETLARHSLVYADSTALGPRFRMLETVREYLTERLAVRPDGPQVRYRHAQYYRSLVEQADLPLRGSGQREWLARLQAEAANLVAAVHWHLDHDRRPLPHMFRVLWLFLAWGDLKDQARSWTRQLMSEADTLGMPDRAELTWAAAAIALWTGDDATALAACQLLEPLMAEIQDPFLHALSQLAVAWSMPIAGDLEEGLRRMLISLEEFRGQDEAFFSFTAAFAAGGIETALDRDTDATAHLSQALNLAKKIDGAWTATGGRTHLAVLNVRQGKLEEGRLLLDEALDLSLTIRNPMIVALCLAGYAQLAFAEGDPECAAMLAGAAEGLRRRVGTSAWAFVRRVEADLTAHVRQQLGEHRFGQIYRVGLGLPQWEAVAAVRYSKALAPTDPVRQAQHLPGTGPETKGSTRINRTVCA
jgi:predicted ATPase/DNA-binding SARP family transcriptional activator